MTEKVRVQKVVQVLVDEFGVSVYSEYAFSDRKFRSDVYIPDYRIAIEIEGGLPPNAHMGFARYKRDMEKYNLMTAMHIWLFRYTTWQIDERAYVRDIRSWLECGERRGEDINDDG